MKSSPAGSIRSGAATPSTQGPSSHGHQPQHQHGFGHLLRHMFENPRHASFAVAVTIHELSNVPQLTGNFAVRWKFRGHRPHDSEKLLENPQKRVKPTDAKPIGGAKGLRGTSSHQSLRPSSTTSLGVGGSAANSNHPRQSSGLVPPAHRAASLQLPAHANTLPAHLDQSLPNLSLGDDDAVADDSDDNGSGTASVKSSRAPSTYSVNSTLSVPGQQNRPRGASSGRAGTAPASLIIDSGPSGRSRSRPASVNSDNSGLEPLTPMTHAPPRALLAGWPSPDSTSRRGMTPMSEIRAHNVDWDYKVQNCVRVMLGKPEGSGSGRNSKHSATPSGSSTPLNGKPTTQGRPPARLGEGPTSDSGLKLEIYQATGKGKDNNLFGYVNIDLAPFADLGPTARKFLLQDSKTNATIRVTVDMRFVGGEQDWLAPALVEGHLVTGVSEIAVEDNLPDLQLLPTRSYSSDSEHSSVSRPSQRSGKSNSAVSLTKQPCANTVVLPPAKHQYKTFEHHLRPEHSAKARRRSESAHGPPARASTIDSTASSLPPLISTQVLTESPVSSPILPPGQISPVNAKVPSNYFERSRRSLDDPSLERRTSLYNGSRLSPIQTSISSSSSRSLGPGHAATVLSPLSAQIEERPLSPPLPPVSCESPTTDASSQQGSQPDFPPLRHLPYHHRHRSLHGRRPSEDLQADLVIEGIFNPVAGEEESPFTFVTENGEIEIGSDGDDSSDTYESQLEEAEPENNAPSSRRWARIRRRVPLPHRREATLA